MNEESKATQKCIQDIMEGKTLLRRGYCRPGQSEYYYLTKNFDGSYNQIDVPDDFGRQWFGKTLPGNESMKQLISNSNSLTGSERIEALKNNYPIKLRIKENPDINGRWPIQHSQTIGEYFVKKYDNSINKYAKKYNVDVDLIKAIMYTENADGHWLGGNYLRDSLKLSKSQAPMNIRGDLWNGMNGKNYNTYDPEQNIELGVQVLQRLSNSIENPTVAKIGTLWNSTARDKVSDFGARVEYNYNNKFWDTSNIIPQLDKNIYNKKQK